MPVTQPFPYNLLQRCMLRAVTVSAALKHLVERMCCCAERQTALQDASAVEVVEQLSPLLNAGLHAAITARSIAWGTSAHPSIRLAPARIQAVNSLLTGLLSKAAASMGHGMKPCCAHYLH